LVDFNSDILFDYRPIWGYKCEEKVCRKVKLSDVQDASGFEVCRIFCGSEIGTLWPKVHGQVKFKDSLERFEKRKTLIEGVNLDEVVYWKQTEERFREHIDLKTPKDLILESGGLLLRINVKIAGKSLGKL
jgi:hexosaminidase